MSDDHARYEPGLEMLRATFANVYGCEGLNLAQRELLTVAVLAALGGAKPQLGVHVRAALRVDVTPREIVEAMFQVSDVPGGGVRRTPALDQRPPGRQAELRRAGRHGGLVLVTGPRGPGRLPLAG